MSECSPRKGYLAFESEGAECRYRNVKIKELPTSDPKKELVAATDEGFKPIFNHTDLEGLETEKDAWKVEGGVLKCVGKAKLTLPAKQTAELLFDWKGPERVKLDHALRTSEWPAKKVGEWQRERVGLLAEANPDEAWVIQAADKLEVRNVYVRERKAEK